MRLVPVVLVCLVAPLAAAEPAGGAKHAKVSPDQKRLLGKWIVRSVQRDGKVSPAQIGQKIGDIITIQKSGAHLMLS